MEFVFHHLFERAELFHYASKLGKLTGGHRTGKGQFSFRSQRMVMTMNVQITILLHPFHMLARLCLKSFKLGFSNA